MDGSGTIGTILLILIGLSTFKGFSDKVYFEKFIFDVDKILIDKEYGRLISSGFLHANWFHFAFNMFALLSFSWSIEALFGIPNFLLIYFGSELGGSLLSLYLHRNHADYRALGASGAISGIVMASIILFPSNSISFIIIPIEITNWVFGLLFMVISIFGIKSKLGNIGHEAHLGGALAGVLIALFLEPQIFIQNWWIVLLIVLPTTIFLYLIVQKPEILLIDKYWGIDLKKKTSLKSEREEKEYNLNFLLDKIKKEGLESLTKNEKKALEKLKDDL